MSEQSRQRAGQFLAVADQFKLGGLVTEASHPVSSTLSDVARDDTDAALDVLFRVDEDVVRAFASICRDGRLPGIAAVVRDALKAGGKIAFTGCGSTGRLSIQLNAIWRDFWQRRRALGDTTAETWEDRSFSAMAGGDFALIKSVEGFEDFAVFGRRQLADLGIGQGDVVFAITEGGETSFVIGTAWEALDRGAKVYFVYNNPDDVLRPTVTRSREVIDEPRIEKLNLTTGPMAITGSTRMQATTIQLCVLTTILEMVVRDLTGEGEPDDAPQAIVDALAGTQTALRGDTFRQELGRLVSFEEETYRSGHRTNYFADRLGVDVLTDTTERSPTYCTPPFRKFDDTTASESWAFLFLPHADTETAWNRLLKRRPNAIEWPESEVRSMVDPQKADRQAEIVKRIGLQELLRFRIGLDGLPGRPLGTGDLAVAVVCDMEMPNLTEPFGFFRVQLEAAHTAGARIAVIVAGDAGRVEAAREWAAAWQPECHFVGLPVPHNPLLLHGVLRAGVKMLLNALSTCTMVRLGRVMGNTMIWVVPSNLKLIDRATRYIARLTGLPYKEACYLLHEVIEYIQPRMLADQAYPPAVGVAVMRAREGLTNEEAEARLLAMQA